MNRPYGYYYGNEADQYTFYRLPKALFTNSRYKDLSERRNISVRQVQILCKAGKIDGVIKFGTARAIPAGAVKPTRTGKLKPGRKPKTQRWSEMDLVNPEQVLYEEISAIIERGRREIILQASRGTVLIFWQVGKRINGEVLDNKRADYGKQIVSRLATQLLEKYGRSFDQRNLRRMMQFAEQFPDFEIVSRFATQLSWAHFVEILPLKTQEAKLFYLEEAARGQIGRDEMRALIYRKAYERKEIANAQISNESRVPGNTFKDPYLLDILGLNGEYLEADLEAAILRELEKFILEFGKGFAFVERQKRMIIDGADFHLDLLFYNRHLKRLVAVELKQGSFKAEYNGQMKLYLKWLNRYEREDGENEPIGLILCAGGSREQIELLEMDKDGIVVAEYWTTLPPKAEFEQKIAAILLETRERLSRRQLPPLEGKTPGEA